MLIKMPPPLLLPRALSLSLLCNLAATESASNLPSLQSQRRTITNSLEEEEKEEERGGGGGGARRRAGQGSVRCKCNSSSSLQVATTAKLQKSSGRRSGNCDLALNRFLEKQSAMFAMVLSEAKAKGPAAQQTVGLAPPRGELEVAECCCCGFREECTPGYARRVRERHGGRWACGLCEEAIKDAAAAAAGPGGEAAKLEEALGWHSELCKRCRSPVPPRHSSEELIGHLKRLLRRILDAQRKEGRD